MIAFSDLLPNGFQYTVSSYAADGSLLMAVMADRRNRILGANCYTSQSIPGSVGRVFADSRAMAYALTSPVAPGEVVASEVYDFVSFQGTLTATGGPAMGLTATDSLLRFPVGGFFFDFGVYHRAGIGSQPRQFHWSRVFSERDASAAQLFQCDV